MNPITQREKALREFEQRLAINEAIKAASEDTAPDQGETQVVAAVASGSASEMPAITAARELAAATAKAELVISFQHTQTVWLLRHIKGAIMALEHDQSHASVHRVLETLKTVHASGCHEMDHLAMPSPNNGISHTQK